MRLTPQRARQRLPDAEIVGAAGSWRLAPRQAYRKHRTFARFALHRHVAAHHACELAGDGKAEAGPAVAACGERIGLGEILEQFRLLLRRHADAGIPTASSTHSRPSATFRARSATSPSFVNLQALLSRLSRICLSR